MSGGTIDFFCPENGDYPLFKSIVTFKLPAVCCGVITKLIKSNDGVSGWDAKFNHCYNHMGGSFKILLDKFGPNGTLLHLLEDENQTLVKHEGGCTCVGCGMFNEYAIPNVGDKYKCFECRSFVS